MSLHDPAALAQEFAAALAQNSRENEAAYIGDRHQRLLEAGACGCCSEGDLLALMSSVHRAGGQWSDRKTWLSRILGIG